MVDASSKYVVFGVGYASKNPDMMLSFQKLLRSIQNRLSYSFWAMAICVNADNPYLVCMVDNELIAESIKGEWVCSGGEIANPTEKDLEALLSEFANETHRTAIP